MSHSNEARNTIPSTVSASLEARLAPYPRVAKSALEDLDVEASRAVTPHHEGSAECLSRMKSSSSDPARPV